MDGGECGSRSLQGSAVPPSGMCPVYLFTETGMQLKRINKTKRGLAGLKWCALSTYWGDHGRAHRQDPWDTSELEPWLDKCGFRLDKSSLGQMCSRSVGRWELLHEVSVTCLVSRLLVVIYLHQFPG